MKNKNDIRIIYMGTPDLSAKTLDELIKSGWNIVALIAQEDKEVGRKKLIEKVPTKVVAEKHNIPVYQPHKIRLDYEFVKELKPDLILTFAYGQILPEELLSIPKYGCLNLHGSLLPKYRGAAPIQRAIINGEKETGITLMKMVKEMDAGEMYAQEKIDISINDNYFTVCDKLSVAATKLINEKLLNYFNNELPGELQDINKVSFANKIKPEDEHIDLNDSTVCVFNKIRGLNYIGLYFMLDNEKIKVYESEIVNTDVKYDVGTIIDKTMLVQLKDGMIRLLKIQPQGKKIMDSRDYLNGHKDKIGHILK